MNGADPPRESGSSDSEEPVRIPINGTLDLHPFHPSDVREVVLEYMEACRQSGIRDLRIIHGKGIGTLREQIHALLKTHVAVQSFSLAPIEAGGWGATLVQLKEP